MSDYDRLTAERRAAEAMALVRVMAGKSSIGEPFSEEHVIRYSSAHYERAREIVAALPLRAPEPVSADEARAAANERTAAIPAGMVPWHGGDSAQPEPVYMGGAGLKAEDANALLPCPFCGGEAVFIPDTSYGGARVICPDDNRCGVQPCADADLTVEDAERAVERWNTRANFGLKAEEPSGDALREALEPLVTRLDDLAATAKRAVADSQGLADHKVLILANYGDLALQLAPAFRAALTTGRDAS